MSVSHTDFSTEFKTPTLPETTSTDLNSDPQKGAAGRAFTDFTLDNGLRVILHEDHTTPMVTINVLYHVGSKNEQRGRTGFAHLFEHLMFDGSKHVQRGGYDLFCTSVGGDNNAFTSSDITDYFISLPSDHLALGLWLESDRMAEFAIQEISLETQKSVVTEEKRQTTDDAPYGEMMIEMKRISYQPEHPYSWETIGSMEDIAAATMEDVRSFYERFYVPRNAVLVVAGHFETEEARELIEGYFGPIPGGSAADPVPADESLRRSGNTHRIASTIVPFNAVFMGFHAPTIYHQDIHALELLCSVLAEGESSRFYQTIEYRDELASETESFIDDGELGSLFYVYAIAQNNKVTPRRLRAALMEEVTRIAEEGITERELEKAKNRKTTAVVRVLQSLSSRAERLAYFKTLYGDPALAFDEAALYESITAEDIRRVARAYLIGVEPNVVEYEVKGKR